jgi:hypothetical protein
MIEFIQSFCILQFFGLLNLKCHIKTILIDWVCQYQMKIMDLIYSFSFCSSSNYLYGGFFIVHLSIVDIPLNFKCKIIHYFIQH